MDDTLSDSQIVVEKLPFGLRMTLLFLRVLAMMLTLPMVGAGLATLAMLSEGAKSPDAFPISLVPGVLGMGAFLVLLVMLCGTAWIEGHLRQSDVPFSSSWLVSQPLHPARQLILPVVGCTAFAGYLAILLWFIGLLSPDLELDFRWPLTWGCVAIAATFLLRWLKVKLPG